MKYGRLIILGSILAGLATPMFADAIYGEFGASGQGTISTAVVGGHTVATGLIFGGTIGTTGGGNVRPTGTVTEDGWGAFYQFTESESFFYHFIASGNPAAAPFLFSSVTPSGVEFLQANADPSFPTFGAPVATMKFYITTVEDITINSGSGTKGVAGGFDGDGYVTFSNVFVPGQPGVLFQQAVQYAVQTNKGAGQRPLTVEIDAVAPSPAPEPSSLALLGTGVIGIAGYVFRKRDKTQA